MSKAVPFKRQRRHNHKWRKVPRRRGRLAAAPWQPLAALLGVAAALWFAAEQSAVEQFPAERFGTERFRAERHPNGMAGHGTFTLCARWNQPNCVIDGDTIRYQGVRIRLADIDAPETRGFECPTEAELGLRATLRLLDLMNAGPFELVSIDRDEDRYGRKLRVVARHGRSVGDTLVAEGLARPWDGARRSWCG